MSFEGIQMKEETYYSRIEDFLKERLNCFATRQKGGSKYVGYADVLGVRDIGGKWSGDVEIIAVEVKKKKGNFGKYLGQALGYSLFAHKCYLAIPIKKGDFSLEEREMANRLGVGLLKIKRKIVEEVLTSRYFQPIENLILHVLNQMKYSKCNICGVVKSLKHTSDPRRAIRENSMLSFDNVVGIFNLYDNRETVERDLLFTETIGKRVNICSNCLSRLR